jgi:D-alanyl-D-alanine carboxypeptidase
MREKLLKRLQQSKFPHLQVLISHPLMSDDLIYSKDGTQPPFHSASVGKMMTAVVILKAIENNLLQHSTRVVDLLDFSIIDGLFENASKVTVEMLLAHMSGVNDYFSGQFSKTESFLDRVIKEPNKHYSPKDLIHFTQTHQQPISQPGISFHYSDTGYVLLGLIAEAVYKKPFDQVLRDQIFNSLGMNDTGLLFYDSRTNPEILAPVIVQGVDLRNTASLSIDFSGGGLQTTLKDLKRFLQGLFQEELVSKQSLKKMMDATNHFEAGMYYGKGMMELRFEKFFFLLKGLPRYYGHLGVLGVHAWIEPESGVIIIMNVSDMKKVVSSFRLLISLVQILQSKRR